MRKPESKNIKVSPAFTKAAGRGQSPVARRNGRNPFPAANNQNSLTAKQTKAANQKSTAHKQISKASIFHKQQKPCKPNPCAVPQKNLGVNPRPIFCPRRRCQAAVISTQQYPAKTYSAKQSLTLPFIDDIISKKG